MANMAAKQPLLASEAVPTTTREAFQVFDKDGSGSLSVSELRAILKRPDGGAPLGDEAIAKVIATYDQNGDGELQIDEFCAMMAARSGTQPGASAPKGGASSVANGIVGKKGGDAGAVKGWRAKLAKYQTTGYQPEMATGKAAQAAEIAAAEFLQKQPAWVLSSSYLESTAKGFILRADEEMRQACEDTSISLQLAEALRGKDALPVDELMRVWDPNKDGSISKLEFRVNVRKLVDKGGYKAKLEDIDALFADMDIDHGGGIGIGELKLALKKLEQRTREASERAIRQRESAELFRQKAALTKEVAAITQLAETHIAQLSAATDASRSLVRNSNDTKHSNVGKGSLNKKMASNANTKFDKVLEGNAVAAQLGTLMLRKGLDADRVAQEWDQSGDGLIQLNEWRKHVLALGVVCESAEIDALFRSLDTDGGGSLDLAEIKVALKSLEEDAFASRQSVRVLSQTAMDLVKGMKAAQGEWRDARRVEEEEEAKQVAQRAKEEADRAAVAAAAAATKEAAKAEKRAAAAAEKAAADQRIAAKRQSQSAPLVPGRPIATSPEAASAPPVPGHPTATSPEDASARQPPSSGSGAGGRGGVLAARSRLKTRLRCELESAEAGSVEAGSRLRVLQQRTLADGTERVQVALEGKSTPLGWVSCVGKDGYDNLVAATVG